MTLVLLGVVAGCMWGGERRKSVDPASVKIDAQRAIAVATSATPGMVQEVRLESRRGKPEYEVMVLPAGGTSRVRVGVDAVTGEVVKAAGGARDRDDDDDED